MLVKVQPIKVKMAMKLNFRKIREKQKKNAQEEMKNVLRTVRI